MLESKLETADKSNAITKTISHRKPFGITIILKLFYKMYLGIFNNDHIKDTRKEINLTIQTFQYL